MSNIIIKDSNKFESIVNDFDKTISKIEEKFDIDKKLFNELNNEGYWEGKLQLSLCDKNKEISDNYETIITSLNELSGFMKSTLDSYKKMDEELSKDIQINNNNLDVNS